MKKLKATSPLFFVRIQNSRESKMPRNQQNISKSKGRKAVKQERYRAVALSDDSAIYGRVIKALGQRQFRVILPDTSMRLIEVTAKIPKKRAEINVSDIVVVAPSGTSYEIQATMDRKTTNALTKEKKIHPDLLAAADWDERKQTVILKDDLGIQFDYEGIQEEVNDKDSVSSSESEKDFDIDDI